MSEHEEQCGCQGHHGQHGRHGHQGHGAGCGCGMGMGHFSGRRFFTREERIARLEEYLKELQAEAKAVEERIAEMKAGA